MVVDQIREKLKMLGEGHTGNKMVHLLLERFAVSHPGNASMAVRMAKSSYHGTRAFRALEDEIYILLFPDDSGAYVEPSGFTTSIPGDVKEQIKMWETFLSET